METKKEKQELRKCPCDLQKCIDDWNSQISWEDAELNDWEYELQHCPCHNIAFGKTSFYCRECHVWFCQDCIKTPGDDFAEFFFCSITLFVNHVCKPL